VGPELEFFLFANDQAPRSWTPAGYFDAPPLDLGNNVRRDIIFALESMASRSSTATTKLPPASMRSTCATPRA
jgi:glutamine synthetase